jgi:hypothetical protein
MHISCVQDTDSADTDTDTDTAGNTETDTDGRQSAQKSGIETVRNGKAHLSDHIILGDGRLEFGALEWQRSGGALGGSATLRRHMIHVLICLRVHLGFRLGLFNFIFLKYEIRNRITYG